MTTTWESSWPYLAGPPWEVQAVDWAEELWTVEGAGYSVLILLLHF